MEVTLFTHLTALTDLREEWQGLFADSVTATPFQSWEWVSTWAEFFLGSRRPQIYAVRDEQGTLVGLYPGYRATAPMKVLRPMGLGMSDYLHPLVRTGYETSAGDALLDFITASDLDVADFCQIRETLPMAKWGSELVEAQCLVVDLPETWEAYTKDLGKNLRYKLSKLRRQVLEEGHATVEWIEPDTVEEFLGVLFNVHGQRWRKRGLPGVFMGPRKQAFHRAYLARATQVGDAWLSMLRQDGQGVAVIYCMRAGSTIFYYQAGFDPAYSNLSPGTLLLSETIRRAISKDCQHFDLMRGDEGYKRNFKPQNCYRNLRVIVPGGAGIKAGLSVRAIEGQTVLGAKIRSRFEGKGLIEAVCLAGAATRVATSAAEEISVEEGIPAAAAAISK
jgi:CelD/BcsL family acetyltransferase involved in cellulose biosynthesis